MGDFGRYVIESGVHTFSRYRTGEDYPERGPREPRVIKRRWAEFVASLSDKQRKTLADQLRDPAEHELSPLELLLQHKKDPLTKQQRELYDAAFVYPKPVNDKYPAGAARRWVFRRTLSLGWTPQRFGSQDQIVGHDRRGRESHKAERWGKKYQWIAYHELLARVADNFQTARLHADGRAVRGAESDPRRTGY